MSIVTDRHAHQGTDDIPATDVKLRDRIETLRQFEREAMAARDCALARQLEAKHAFHAADHQFGQAVSYLDSISKALRVITPAASDDTDTYLHEGGWETA